MNLVPSYAHLVLALIVGEYLEISPILLWSKIFVMCSVNCHIESLSNCLFLLLFLKEEIKTKKGLRSYKKDREDITLCHRPPQ